MAILEYAHFYQYICLILSFHYSDKIYRSVNAGLTWVVLANSGIRDWFRLSCSSGGQTVVATEKVDSDLDGNIWVLLNAGLDWELLGKYGQNAVVTADGQTIYAVSSLGVAFIDQEYNTYQAS